MQFPVRWDVVRDALQAEAANPAAESTDRVPTIALLYTVLRYLCLPAIVPQISAIGSDVACSTCFMFMHAPVIYSHMLLRRCLGTCETGTVLYTYENKLNGLYHADNDNSPQNYRK